MQVVIIAYNTLPVSLLYIAWITYLLLFLIVTEPFGMFIPYYWILSLYWLTHALVCAAAIDIRKLQMAAEQTSGNALYENSSLVVIITYNTKTLQYQNICIVYIVYCVIRIYFCNNILVIMCTCLFKVLKQPLHP